MGVLSLVRARALVAECPDDHVALPSEVSSPNHARFSPLVQALCSHGPLQNITRSTLTSSLPTINRVPHGDYTLQCLNPMLSMTCLCAGLGRHSISRQDLGLHRASRQAVPPAYIKQGLGLNQRRSSWSWLHLHFTFSCSMAEAELKLVFRPGSALQHGVSLACKKLSFHRRLRVVLK